MSTPKKNLFTKAKMNSESATTVVEVSDSLAETIEVSEVQKPEAPAKPNVFNKIRDIEEAPMHVTESFAEKPVPKSYSLYQQDLERIENFKETLKTKSRGRLYDSLIVRVALAYLDESYEKGGKQFEKDIKRLISENR